MSNNMIKFLKSRETVYDFSSKKITKGELETILETARWAPSCLNSQPWKFIVIESKATIRKLIELCFYGLTEHQPPIMVAIVMDHSDPFMDKFYVDLERKFIPYIDYMNASMPGLIMTYAAEALGISSCIKTPITHEANRILKVPADKPVVMLIGLGYEISTSKNGRKRERKPLSKLVFKENFGNR